MSEDFPPNTFVVFIPVFRRSDGVQVSTHFMCVATEERAKEIASGNSTRSYRAMTEAEQIEDIRRRSEAMKKFAVG